VYRRIDAVSLSENNPLLVGKLPAGAFTNPSIMSVSANVSWDETGFGYPVRQVGLVVQMRTGSASGGALVGSRSTTLNTNATIGTATLSVEIDLSAFSMPLSAYHLEISFSTSFTGTDYGNGSGWFVYGFTYYPYSVPTIPSLVVYRCLANGIPNDSGEYVSVTAGFSASGLGGNNELSLNIHRKRSDESHWTFDKAIPIPSDTYSGVVGPVVLALSYGKDYAFNIRATLADSLSSATNTKTVQAEYSAGDVDVVNHQEAWFGRLAPDSPKPGGDFKEPVRFRKWIQIDDISTTLARLMPYCKLFAPTAENITFNASFYMWVINFTMVGQNDNDAYSILVGGSGGARKMGWIIPADGWYRVMMHAFLGGTTSSAMGMLISRMPNDWTTPVNNFLAMNSVKDQALEYAEHRELAYATGFTFGYHTAEFYAEEGQKIWPSIGAGNATKPLVSNDTWASIQRIG